jgi:hypothetical protein
MHFLKHFLMAAEGTPPGTAEPPPPAETPPAEAAEGTPAPSTEPAPPPAEADADPWKGTWLAQLPKETRIKHKDLLEQLKDKHLSDLLEEYASSRNMLDRAIIMPDKHNAKPEEIDAFLAKLDIPKTADGYGLERTRGVDPAFAREAADRMLKIGLTRKQGAQVFAELLSLAAAGNSQQQAAKKAIASSFDGRLTEDLGNNKAKADETFEYFKRWMVGLKNKELCKDLADSGMIYNTHFVRAMAAQYQAANREPPLPEGARGIPAERPAEGLPKGKAFQDTYGGTR